MTETTTTTTSLPEIAPGTVIISYGRIWDRGNLHKGNYSITVTTEGLRVDHEDTCLDDDSDSGVTIVTTRSYHRMDRAAIDAFRRALLPPAGEDVVGTLDRRCVSRLSSEMLPAAHHIRYIDTDDTNDED
jgi:hypothetical protein